MRVWKGIEREGRGKGVKTLFVESPKVGREQSALIKGIAQREKIGRIYFGAGKIDTLEIDGLDLLQGLFICVEVSAGNMERLHNRENFNEVIVRIDCKKNDHNLRLKADNGDKVTIYYQGIDNSIKDVKNGLYKEDKMLWKD